MGAGHGSRIGPDRPQRRQGVVPRERPYGQGAELVADLWNQVPLGALAAYEYDLGAFSAQRVGDCQRRYYVTGRPARRDHDPRPAHRPAWARAGAALPLAARCS